MKANPGGNEQLTALAGVLLTMKLALCSPTAVPCTSSGSPRPRSTSSRASRSCPAALRARYPGVAARLGLIVVTVVAGAAVAVATLPGADHLQDRVTAQLGLDAT